MKYDIDKFSEKLSNLKVQPSEDLFDDIYNKYNKKRKNRFIIWWFPTLIGLGIIFVTGYYISTLDREKSITSHSTNKNTQYPPTKIKNEEEELCPTINRENKINTVNDIDNNINKKEISQPAKNIITSTDKKNIITTKKSNQSLQQNNEIYTSLSLQTVGAQSANAIQKSTVSEIINFDKPTSLVAERNEEEVLQLVSPILFLDIERKISYPDINIVKKPPLESILLPQFIIDVYASAGAQQFCSFASAQKATYSFSLNTLVLKNIYLKVGISQSSINYSYDFTQVLSDRFGQTDKFPVLSLLNPVVQNISNSIDYKTLDIGITTNIINHKKHQLLGSVHQELLISSKQLISYGLTQNRSYLYQKTNNNIRKQQLISSLIYNYKITKNLGLGCRASYNYSLDYLGLERERYSGFNFGINLMYGF